MWKSIFVVFFQITSLLAKDISQARNELETRGFTVLSDLFSKTEIQQMADRFQNVKNKAFQIIENTPSIERNFAETTKNIQSLYWKTDRELIMQAGVGRYDLYLGFSQDLFSSSESFPHPALEDLMKNIMVDEFTSYAGIVHSMAGSEDQYWHRDTNTLDNHGSEGSKLVMLDDFYFTVLIPITVPFTIENGTTEFIEGSHKLSVTDSTSCSKCQTEVPLGSALIFNGKIIHRGKANHSLEDRPALYIVFHKKWYNEHYRRGVENL